MRALAKGQYSLAHLVLIGCFSFGSLVAQNKPLVVASTTMIADMARNVAGPYAEVRCLMPVGGDPHLYEPTPADARLLTEAKLVLRNGLSLEGWLDRLIATAGANAQLTTCSDGVVALMSAEHGSPDPHAWMDAANGIIYVNNIETALAKLDPTHAREYARRAIVYKNRLREADSLIRSQVQRIPPARRILITSHDAFHYFGKAYGMEVDATMGTSTDADVRTADLSRLSKSIIDRGIPAIFVESTVNPKLLEQLAQDKRIRIGGELFADSLGDEKSGGATYLDMLLHNAKVIVDALSAPTEAQQENSNENEKKPMIGAYLTIGLAVLLIMGIFGVLWWDRREGQSA